MTYAMKLEEVRKAALKEGREEGLNEGLAKGQLLALREIIKNLGFSAEKAMNALGIPKADQPDYLSALENMDISSFSE